MNGSTGALTNGSKTKGVCKKAVTRTLKVILIATGTYWLISNVVIMNALANANQGDAIEIGLIQTLRRIMNALANATQSVMI